MQPGRSTPPPRPRRLAADRATQAINATRSRALGLASAPRIRQIHPLPGVHPQSPRAATVPAAARHPAAPLVMPLGHVADGKAMSARDARDGAAPAQGPSGAADPRVQAPPQPWHPRLAQPDTRAWPPRRGGPPAPASSPREHILSLAREGAWWELGDFLCAAAEAPPQRLAEVLEALLAAREALGQPASSSSSSSSAPSPSPSPSSLSSSSSSTSSAAASAAGERATSAPVAELDKLLDLLAAEAHGPASRGAGALASAGSPPAAGLADNGPWVRNVIGSEQPQVLTAFYTLLGKAQQQALQDTPLNSASGDIAPQMAMALKASARSAEHCKAHLTACQAQGVWPGLKEVFAITGWRIGHARSVSSLFRDSPALFFTCSRHIVQVLAASDKTVRAERLRHGGIQPGWFVRSLVVASSGGSAPWRVLHEAPSIPHDLYHWLRWAGAEEATRLMPIIFPPLAKTCLETFSAGLDGMIDAGVSPLAVLADFMKALRSPTPSHAFRCLVQRVMPRPSRSRNAEGDLVLIRPTGATLLNPPATGAAESDAALRAVFEQTEASCARAFPEADPLPEVVTAVLIYLRRFDDQGSFGPDAAGSRWVPDWTRLENLLREAIPGLSEARRASIQAIHARVMSASPAIISSQEEEQGKSQSGRAVQWQPWSLDPAVENQLMFSASNFVIDHGRLVAEALAISTGPRGEQQVGNAKARRELEQLHRLLSEPVTLRRTMSPPGSFEPRAIARQAQEKLRQTMLALQSTQPHMPPADASPDPEAYSRMGLFAEQMRVASAIDRELQSILR